jgi:hypothetical protein
LIQNVFRIFIFAPAIFFLLVNNNAIARPVVKSIEPTTVKYGQATEIKLQFDNLPPGAQLAVTPGGPYSVASLAPNESVQAVTLTGDQSLLAAKNKFLLVDYQNDTPAILSSIPYSKEIQHVAIHTDNIAIATNTELSLVKLVKRTSLLPAGSIDLKRPITAVVLTEQYAGVLLDQNELVILDIKKPTKIEIAGRVRLDYPAKQLYISNNLCYTTAGPKGLYVWDISHPKNILPAGQFNTSGDVRDVYVQNGLAYLADGPAGLTILDIRDPSNIHLAGSNNKLGFVTHIAVDRDQVLVANTQSKLTLLNTGHTELPLLVDRFKVNNPIVNLAYRNHRALAISSRNVNIVDFSTESPDPVSKEGINLGGSRRAFIENDKLYVADWFSGLHIYDISIPQQPAHIGNYHTDGSSKGVVVRNGYAFVGDDDHGLKIINVRDPHNPVLVSKVLTTGLAYTLKLVDNLVYLADHRGGLHIIDISDIKTPKIIGSYDTPGKAWAVDVIDHYAYVADDTTGILIFDISQTNDPKLVGQFSPGGYAEDIHIRGKYAYAVFFDKGLYILDITNRTKPEVIGHLAMPGNARGIELKDNLAYISAWEAGLQIVDISELSKPKIIGYYDTSGSAWGVNVKNDYAYVLDWWGGVKIINVHDPLNPSKVGQYHGKGTIQQIATKGNYAVLANGSNGAQVFDLKNPLNPIWVTGIDFPGDAQDVAINNNYAYIAAGDGGVVIVDITDPFQAKWAGAFFTAGSADKVRIHDHQLIITDNVAGIISADITDPVNPLFTQQINEFANDIWMNGNQLIVAGQDKKLTTFYLEKNGTLTHQHTFKSQFDIKLVRAYQNKIITYERTNGIRILQTTPSGLKELDFFDLGEDVFDMRVKHNTLYVTGEKSGFMAVEITNNNKLRLQNIYPTHDPVRNFAVLEDYALLAGEPILSSVQLLPTTKQQVLNTTSAKLNFPKDMPIGSYGVVLSTADKTTYIFPNLIQVKMQKPKKPGFTMEEFKKILEERKKQNMQQ